MLALVLPAALLGLAVGSFLNVVIHRLPRRESLVVTGSHCPACDAPIRARHNVPVLGWLVLRGKCADCAAPISPRYPVVEAFTGLLFVAVTLRLDDLGLLFAVPAYLWFTAAGVALAAIDIDLHRLPNAIVLPSYGVIAALLTVSSAVSGDWAALVRAGLGAVALFAFFYLLAFAYPAGMGFGDVKLAGVLGLVLGYQSWSAVVIGGFTGFLLGAVVAVIVLARGRGDRKSALPFGPFMIAGALLALFVAEPISTWYLRGSGFA